MINYVGMGECLHTNHVRGSKLRMLHPGDEILVYYELNVTTTHRYDQSDGVMLMV